MRISKINKLIKILENHDVDEIQLSNWFSKLKIIKRSGSIITESADRATTQKVVKEVQQEATSETQPTSASKEAKTEAAPDTNSNQVEIKSPIVGTFYRAPAPDSDPFVEVGDSFNTGDTLCIVEAMKVMNEIEAEFSGKIVKMLVENSEPVEYDQPLFLVEKQ